MLVRAYPPKNRKVEYDKESRRRQYGIESFPPDLSGKFIRKKAPNRESEEARQDIGKQLGIKDFQG